MNFLRSARVTLGSTTARRERAARALHNVGLLGLASIAAFASCGWPVDPEGTTEAVRGGELRVAAVHAPPWIEVGAGGVTGLETHLVERLARVHGARVRWLPMGEQGAMDALERFRVHLVVGGLEKTSPWRTKVAFARPYLRDRASVGTEEAMSTLSELRRVEVAVAEGSSLAAELERRGALPRELPDPWSSGLPVAAEDWELLVHGYTPRFTLRAVERVVAAPPGENGWLLAIERVLRPLDAQELARIAARTGAVAVIGEPASGGDLP